MNTQSYYFFLKLLQFAFFFEIISFFVVFSSGQLLAGALTTAEVPKTSSVLHNTSVKFLRGQAR